MNNRFKKLFAIGKELGMDIELLREGASEWTGKPSLRSLNNMQLLEYTKKLEAAKKKAYYARKKAITSQFQINEILTPNQRQYLIDLIVAVFRDIHQFRSWLKNYFQAAGIQHERYLSTTQARKVITALADMKKRRFRT